jgi:hypothetical protein
MNTIKLKWSTWNKRQRTTAILLALLLIGSVSTGIVIAAGLLFGHQSYTMNPSAGYAYSIDLTGSTDVGEIIPGESFSINPSITNNSTGSVYAFVRINCESFNDRPIYNLENLASGWTIIDELCDSENIVIAYGSGESMTTLEPGDTAALTGSLKLSVDNRDFASVKDNLTVTIHGCAVHSEAEGDVDAVSSSPVDAYTEYIALGGD